MKYTEEEINERFNGESPDELEKVLSDYEASAKSYRTKQREEIQKYRNLVYGDEYSKRSEYMPDSDRIQTRMGKALVDFVVASVFDQPLGAEVKADNLPYISEELSQQLMEFAPAFGVRIDPAKLDQAIAELIGELFTAQFDTFKRESKLIEALRRAVEFALVDRCALLKDTVDPLGRYMLKSDVVTLDSFFADPYAPDWCDVQWVCHEIPIRQEEFAVKYPWVVKALERKGLIGSIKDLFERYFTSKKADQGQIWPQTADADSNSKRAPVVIQEWWVKDYETVEDPLYAGADGQVTKDPQGAAMGEDGQPLVVGKAPPRYRYQGQWKRVYRYQNEVLEVSPNPFPHYELPFTLIRPKSKANDWRGVSWLYDLHDLLVNINKTVAMAAQNAIDTCNSLRIINPAAAENARDLRSKQAGVKDVILKPDYTFDQLIYQPPPVPINQSIFDVANYLDGLLMRVAGAGDFSQPLTKNGEQQQQAVAFAVRNTLDQVKKGIETVALHYLYNAAEFINENRSFALTDTQTVMVKMNPVLMKEVTSSFESRFTVVATQSEPLPTDPKQRVEAIVGLTEAAAQLSAATGLPLSTTLAITKPPGYGQMLRQIKRAEMAPKPPSEQEQEKLDIRENATQQTLKDIFEEAQKTIAKSSPMAAQFVTDQFTSGQTRNMLEMGLNPQPQAAQPGPGMMPPQDPSAMMPGQQPLPQ